MFETSVSYDDGGLGNRLNVAAKAIGDPLPALRLFQNYMRTQTVMLFQNNARGGDYRGAHWDYFASQYTRKRDGVTVPAWGGVPYENRKGTVKGKKRPSGQRITESSAILQDTRRLLRSVTTALDINQETPTAITWGTSLPYAAKQNERRPFLFFIEQDARKLERLYFKFVMGESTDGDAGS